MDGLELWQDKFARGMVRNFAPPDFPTIVCLCGSTRFYEAFQKANYDETMAGRIVLSVGHYPHVSKRRVIVDGCMGEQEVTVDVVQNHGESVGCTPEQKIALDVLHKQKIDLADEILVLNVGGYIGSSTRSEIMHAIMRGKLVRWLETDKIPTEFV